MKQPIIISKAERRGIVMLAITMSFAFVLKSLPIKQGPPVIVYTTSESGKVTPDTLKRVYIERPKAIASHSQEPIRKSRLTSVDVNLSDSMQLQALRGIGPVISSRVVRYRDRLGGFVHLNQLLEVYGIDSLILNKNKGRIRFTPMVYDSLHINTASFKQVLRHPYVSYEDTKRIVNYRRQNGPFKSLNDLKKVHGLTPKVLEKLGPYLNYGL